MPEQSNTPPETPVEVEPAGKQDKLVVIRYGRMVQTGVFRHDRESPPPAGTMLVVRTERGTELGKVLINIGQGGCGLGICPKALDDYLAACGPDYPFARGGRVLRAATAQDLNDQQHLNNSAGEELAFCRQQIQQLEMKMKLVAVEHLLGGERIVFYFISESRVDFRELVRRLAGQYHTRIELRQVGARDEARLVADYERCGRRCCCQEYIKLLKPVSMKMAKTQKATLDPTKISGRCGRLMCCLRYEDATYEQLQGRLPRKNSWVKTAQGVVGKVLDMQILTQLVRLLLPDYTQVVVPADDIAERDLPAPAMIAPQVRPHKDVPPRPTRRRLEQAAPDQPDQRLDQDAATAAADEMASAAGDGSGPLEDGALEEDARPPALDESLASPSEPAEGPRESEGAQAPADQSGPGQRQESRLVPQLPPPAAQPSGASSDDRQRQGKRHRRGRRRRGRHPEALSAPPRAAGLPPQPRPPAPPPRPDGPPGV